MALFEGYERKIDKINGVLAQYGLALHPDTKILIAFIWLSGQTYDSAKVEKAVKAALEKIVDSLER